MDISGHLLCRPSEIDPARPVGLWWCADVLDVQTVVRNAAAKPSAAQWDSLPHFLFYNGRSFAFLLSGIDTFLTLYTSSDSRPPAFERH